MTLPVSPAHARLLAALSQGHGGRRFVIIGAVALGHHIALPRATADVDLALVAELDEFDSILGKAGWVPDPRTPQRWCDHDGNKADVVPATPRLVQEGSISFGRGTKMSLVGFDLAFGHTVRVTLPGYDLEVEVACLPALVVLKIVAWLDRPHERAKDLGDLGRVLASALEELDDRRWAPPLAGEAFEDQSPLFVGLEVRRIANGLHDEKIREFIRKLKDDSQPWLGTVARLAGFIGDDATGTARRYLAGFERGLDR